jgi:two-component system, NarL family, nitrate/nitrite sensor histidine kinase NarX
VHQVVPRANVTVYAFHPRKFQLEAQAVCDARGFIQNPPDIEEILEKDRQVSGEQKLEFKLSFQGRQAGLLELNLPPGCVLNRAQGDLLDLVSPMSALALENILLRNLLEEQTSAAEANRRRLARDLHDTLAQNIGYLRLKLDQLTSQPLLTPSVPLMEELDRMHATAEEAYLQVRSTLDELNPVPEEDVQDSLEKLAQAIARRAGIQMRFHQIGTRFALPAATSHHILYVAREALHNVEKHARARRVLVQLLWLEHELILKITDDGIGFDPLQTPVEGHYGLWIMSFRAREAGGDLNITPAEEGKGTEVTLWVPRPEAFIQPSLAQQESRTPAEMI